MSLSDRMASFTGQDAQDAREEFGRYMAGLAETKRADPGEDVITDLVRAQAEDASYGYTEMVRLCVGLLFAGHETTVNRIGLGTLFLLTRRDQWEALVTDPDGRIDAVIEEIMRLGAPGDLGLLRAGTDRAVVAHPAQGRCGVSEDGRADGFVRHRGGPDGSGLLLSSANVPEIQNCLGVATVPEGVALDVETAHSTGEVMYVAAGSGELRRRGEPIAFRQGDAIFIPAGEWHSLANTGIGDLVSVFSFPYPGRPVSESRPVATGEA